MKSRIAARYLQAISISQWSSDWSYNGPDLRIHSIRNEENQPVGELLYHKETPPRYEVRTEDHKKIDSFSGVSEKAALKRAMQKLALN